MPGPYQLILADPPWQFRDQCNAGKRGAVHKYPVMALADMMLLPVADHAAKDCLLAMWWVAAMPAEALALVESWGFTVKTMTGFTWHKQSKHGKEHIGMGNYTRANAENCLFAVRGRPQRASKGVRQFLSTPITTHSEKPPMVRDRLVQLMGDVPRLELFARHRIEGWHVWGNHLPHSDVEFLMPQSSAA
jgi:N6-adenosine-specific RNA methylase IME4